MEQKTTSGISYFATVGDGPITDMREYNGEALVVSGGKLYVLHADGTSELIGDGDVTEHLP